VWLAELAAVTDQDMVPGAIAQALGIPAQPGRPVLDALADALGPQELLIVLDNCEHLLGGCAKTVETILQRCPEVQLIATSREPLGIAGERLYRVPSLSLPQAGDDDDAAASSCDAVSLLADRASTHGVSLDLAAGSIGLAVSVSVCRRLDGMPLAIELAAARLRSMSLGELSGRLDHRFRLLTGGSRTALARQQTLHAAIGWSYSLLTPAEQLLLARLSVFAGGFDLPAAEAVCGYGTIDAAEVAVLLGSLVDKSLVAAEPAGDSVRYGLLETIRLFAAERLADAGGQEAAAASAPNSAHYLAVAEVAAPHLLGSDQVIWQHRLETERANIMRAAKHASGQPDGTSQVLRFGVALRRYWVWHYRSEEAAGLLVPVLRRPDAAENPMLFAEALYSASSVTQDIDLPMSVQLAEQMDQIAGGLGDDRLLALCRGMLAYLYFRAGDRERGQPLGKESVQRARKLGDDGLLVRTLTSYIATVDAAAAPPLFKEAIACSERAGNILDYYVLHNNAACNALELGDIPSAGAHLEAAIRAAQVMGYPPIYATNNLDQVLLAEHDLAGARRAFEDAILMGRGVGANRQVERYVTRARVGKRRAGRWCSRPPDCPACCLT
jgi:predicted ATPase